jgi:hypothetical protein
VSNDAAQFEVMLEKAGVPEAVAVLAALVERVRELESALADAVSWIENYPLNLNQTGGWTELANELRNALAAGDVQRPDQPGTPTASTEGGSLMRDPNKPTTPSPTKPDQGDDEGKR